MKQIVQATEYYTYYTTITVNIQTKLQSYNKSAKSLINLRRTTDKNAVLVRLFKSK